MAQTKAGGRKLRQTMIARFGSEEAWKEYMRNNGREGGKLGKTGGFHYAKKHYKDDDPRHPANAGRIGGTISRRTA